IGPAKDLLDRDLKALAGQRPRHSRHLHDVVGDVARREVLTNRSLDALLELVKVHLCGRDYKQWHVIAAIRQLHSDHEAVDDPGERVDDRVDVSGPHADAGLVERRVRSSADDHAAPFGELDPVTVTPATLEARE